MESSTIDQCYNSNTITSKHSNGNISMKNEGGIVGCALLSTIKNTYNVGSICGDDKVGGIIGYVWSCSVGDNINVIDNSYNANENIKSTTVNYGSLIGYYEGINSKNTGYTKGMPYCGGNGGTKYRITWGLWDEYTIEGMKNRDVGAKTSLTLLEILLKGDGVGIWEQDENINNGLPYLKNVEP